jgi:asparagine N-glycosylation enzyme membrane subunit Stt3
MRLGKHKGWWTPVARKSSMTNAKSFDLLEFYKQTKSIASFGVLVFRRFMFPILFTAACLFILAAYVDDYSFFMDNKSFYFIDDNPPIVASDGYYFLTVSEELSESRDAETWLKSPGLSIAAAAVHKLTNFSLESIAFYLPVVFGFCTVIIYALWGRRLLPHWRATVPFATALGMTSVYWHLRVNLGYFDTDCLNVLLLYLGCLHLSMFVEERSRRRFYHLAGLFLVMGFFIIWWRQVSVILVPAYVGTYVATFYRPSGPWEKKVKYLLAAVLAVGMVFFLLRDEITLPKWLDTTYAMIADHVGLVTHIEDTTVPQVADSIAELKTPEFHEIISITFGNVFIFSLSIIGLCIVIWERHALMVHMLPILALSASTIFSARFAIFAVPLMAIGLGRLAAFIYDKARGNAGIVVRTALVFGCLFVLSINIRDAWTLKNPPPFNAGEVLLAKLAGEDAGEKRELPRGLKPVLWNWWDYGYMLEYYSQLESYFHGGTQEPEGVYIIAAGLSQSDPEVAARWMRFFVVQHNNGLRNMEKRTGSMHKAVTFLQRAFKNPDDLEALCAEYNLDLKEMRKILFPGRDVYVYIPMRMIDKSIWIYSYGTWDFERMLATKPFFEPTNKAGLKVDFDKARLIRGDSFLPLERYVRVVDKGVAVKKLQNDAPYSVVEVQGVPHLFIMDSKYMDTLMYRLLFFAPYETPSFTPVIYNSLYGGVWKVE